MIRVNVKTTDEKDGCQCEESGEGRKGKGRGKRKGERKEEENGLKRNGKE